MKKILFLLLCTVSIYGQTSTGQEQSFPYGIVNESLQTITTPPYIGTFGTDGTQGKIPSAYIAKTSDIADSLATKENIANKSDSYTVSSSTNYASTKALVDGLGTKQNTLTNPITGTGTNGHISFWNGTNSQTGDSGLFWDNTNKRLGIGTTTPSDTFTVKTPLQGYINFGGSDGRTLSAFNSASVISVFNFAEGASIPNIYGNNFYDTNSNTQSLRLTTTTASIWTNSLQRITISNGGALLINTTTDNGIDKLQINGSTKTTALTLSTTPTTSAETYDILTRNTSTGVVEKVLSSSVVGGSGTINTIPKFTASGTVGNSSIQDSGSLVSVNSLSEFKGTAASDGGQLGSELTTTATGTNWTGTGFGTGYTHTIGDVTPLVSTLAAVTNNLYQITYTVTGRTTGSVTINYGGIAITGITSSGNSGPKAISTATLNIVPTTDFNGTVALSIKIISPSVATTSFKNSSGAVVNEIRAHSSSSNISLGSNAGKSNTTGSNNSAVGIFALQTNTTGSNNSAFGYGSMQSNTTGSSNNAVGGSSLAYNTTGISNNAVGSSALQNNTTGSNNSAFGYASLQNNTTGTNNSAIGANASRYIADKSTPATILNNSIMLGYRTSPLADNQTNQVVIGNDATGLGSNTTVIGNSSTTTARVYGRQLVNTSTDNGTDQLQVNGTISATGGTTANQVVVKSQLDGKADLASPSFTGTPTAPTATAGTNTTQIATTAFVQAVNADNVKLTGTQTVAGVKTFSSSPIVPTAVNANEAVNKGQLDGKVSLTGNETIAGVKTFSSDIFSNSLSAASSDVLTLSAGGTSLEIDDTNSTITAGGDIKATNFIRTSALPGQLLKADGNVTAGYKVYTALLSQSGTSAPTATVLENTLGGTIVWTRNGTGAYQGTLTGAFTGNKTFIINGNVVANRYVSSSRGDTDTIYVFTGGSLAEDTILQQTSIEIRVYN